MLGPPSALVGSRRQAGRTGLVRRDHRYSMQCNRALKAGNPLFVSIWGHSAGFGSKLPTLQPCAANHREWGPTLPPYRAPAEYPIPEDATGRTPATDTFGGSIEEGAPVSQKSCGSRRAHTIKGKLQRGFGLPVRIKTNPEQFIPTAEHADQSKSNQQLHERHPVPYQNLGGLP